MKELVNRMVTATEYRRKLAARNRARLELLSRTDFMLRDLGLSRGLLEAGVDAWPWRRDNSAQANTGDAARIAN